MNRLVDEFKDNNLKEIISFMRDNPGSLKSLRMPVLTFRSQKLIDRGRYDFQIDNAQFHYASVERLGHDQNPDDVSYDPSNVGNHLYHCVGYSVMVVDET